MLELKQMRHWIKTIGCGLALVLSFLSVSSFAGAQTTPLDAAFVTLTLSPRIPAPGETFIARLESSVYDLDRATISWYFNDTLKGSAVGLKQIAMAPAKNQTSVNVTALLQLFDGTRIRKDVSYSTGNVDIFWQSTSTVPPFYRGKSLYPSEGSVTLIALPDFKNSSGTVIPASTIIYTWTQNGRVLGEQSGTGKFALVLNGGVKDGDTVIQVEAETVDGSKHGAGTLRIAPSPSKVLLYENNPLYGVRFEHALTDSINLSTSEFSLYAAPYYFDLNPAGMSYVWSVNGKPTNQDGAVALFRQPPTGEGVSLVHLIVQQGAKVLQKAEAELTFVFKGINAAGL